MWSILFSKTVLFTALGAFLHVTQDLHNPTTWAESINAVMVAYAARSAIAKSGPVSPAPPVVK